MTAILGASMLAGCGSSSDSSSDEKSGSSKGKTELTFGIWDENQRPAMEKLIEAYEKENENVTVKIQLTPYKGGEYWTKLEAAAGGRKVPTARPYPAPRRASPPTGRCRSYRSPPA